MKKPLNWMQSSLFVDPHLNGVCLCTASHIICTGDRVCCLCVCLFCQMGFRCEAATVSSKYAWQALVCHCWMQQLLFMADTCLIGREGVFSCSPGLRTSPGLTNSRNDGAVSPKNPSPSNSRAWRTLEHKRRQTKGSIICRVQDLHFATTCSRSRDRFSCCRSCRYPSSFSSGELQLECSIAGVA